MLATCCVRVHMAGSLYKHIDHSTTAIKLQNVRENGLWESVQEHRSQYCSDNLENVKENGLCHSYDQTLTSCVS